MAATTPLRKYFETLFVFAEKDFEKVDASTGVDLDKVVSLHSDGCLVGIDAETLDGGPAFLNMRLSARGAIVLAEWGALLERGTLRSRLLSLADRIAFLVMGALLTTLGRLLTG